MTSSIKVNVLSNYVAKLWGLISVYIFIPAYIHVLGNENYALIAFQSVILSFVFIADAGLGASFSRECAKEKNTGKLLILLSGIEMLLCSILSFIAIIFFLTSPLIAKLWLKIENPQFFDETVFCLKLMAIGIVPQVMISLYYGGIMGLEKQLQANGINIVYTLLRSGGVLLPLIFWKSIEIYFLWYVIVSLCFCLLFRFYLVRILARRAAGVESEKYERVKLLKSIFSFSLGMLCLSIIAAVNNQLDRLYVSYKFSLVNFSYYNLSSILGQVPFLIVLPLAVTILPRLTKLLSEHKTSDVYRLYEDFSFYISSISSTAVFSLIFYKREVIELWLGNDYVHSSIVELVPLLALGTLFLALQLMPFQLSIANGHNKTSVKLGVANILLYPVLLYLFCSAYGIVGATIPWFIINFINFIVLSILINKYYYQGVCKWILSLCVLPTIISFIIVYIGYLISNILASNYIYRFLLGSVFGLFSLTLLFLLYKKRIKL